jgi:hypothetical protein
MATVTYDSVIERFGDVTTLGELLIHISGRGFLFFLGAW